MTMGDSEIKNLLVRANAQVHIDEARKQKTHQAMMMEMDKQEINKQSMVDDDVHQKYSASAISVYG